MAPQTVPIEKRYRVSLLLEAYGELLTEKQRTFLRRYYDGDFSLGEIAGEFNVTRQAIFDAMKHGEASLENYERVLRLVEFKRKKKDNGSATHSDSEISERLESLGNRLRELALSAQKNERGDSEQMVRELVSVAEEMDALAEGSILPRVSPLAPDVFPTRARATTPTVRLGESPEVD